MLQINTLVNQYFSNTFSYRIKDESFLTLSPFAAEVQKEVERIYDLTKGLNMVVIDCDVMNHPSQLLDCSLAPIAVYIKMDPGILEKLVKLRGSKRKNVGAQVVAAQKLAQCNEVQSLLYLLFVPVNSIN